MFISTCNQKNLLRKLGSYPEACSIFTQEGVLELEGSEEFVSQHIETLTDLALIISRHTLVEKAGESLSSTLHPNTSPSNTEVESVTDAGLTKHSKVFSEINGKLKLATDIPGDTTKAKMINVALLYCYGSSLMGESQVSSKEIRTLCEEHGCLDKTNFASIFTDRTLFLADGVKGGNKEVKLTFQGTQKATQLAEQLDDDTANS